LFTVHDEHTRRILDTIELGQPISQRSLARELGVALGLANLLVRRLVSKGFIKMLNVRPNRVRYVITSAGMSEKARITRAYFDNTVRLYTHTREQIRRNFLALSASWPSREGNAASDRIKRVLFYGAGEVAEIGYISLQTTDLHLVGVVDDYVDTNFFGQPVHRPEDLQRGGLDGEPFSVVIIMSFRNANLMRAKLDRLGVPSERIYPLLEAPSSTGAHARSPRASRQG
jgi:DNA-binding MarR family transcriptional regulator